MIHGMAKEVNISEALELFGSSPYGRESVAAYESRTKEIARSLAGAKDGMEGAACGIYWMYATKAFMTGGFLSVTDYAKQTFDIGKSSCYSFISVVERFGERGEDGKPLDRIADRYREFGLSKLSLLTGLTDESMEALGITPKASVRDIKRRLKELARESAGPSGSAEASRDGPPEGEEGTEAQEAGRLGTEAQEHIFLLSCTKGEFEASLPGRIEAVIRNAYASFPGCVIDVVCRPGAAAKGTQKKGNGKANAKGKRGASPKDPQT